MMHHATKRGFKDCPGFLNSTGRLGPNDFWKCRPCLALKYARIFRWRSRRIGYTAPADSATGKGHLHNLHSKMDKNLGNG